MDCHAVVPGLDGGTAVSRSYACTHTLAEIKAEQTSAPEPSNVLPLPVQPATTDHRCDCGEEWLHVVAHFQAGRVAALGAVATCGSCGKEYETPRGLDRVEPLAVPPEGHVLLLATIPGEALTEAAVDDLLVHLHAVAEQVAPGRFTVIATQAGTTLELLTDEQLAAVGLARLHPVQPLPVEERLPTEAQVIHGAESAHLR